MANGNDTLPSDEKKPIDYEKLFTQLKIAADARTAIGHESWVVFSIFCATSAVLLNALFQSCNPPFILIKWLVVSIAGLFLSSLWLIIQNRILKWQKFYEKIVDDIEIELQTDKRFRTGGKDNQKLREMVSGFSTRKIMKGIIISAMIAWSIMLGIGVCIGLAFARF